MKQFAYSLSAIVDHVDQQLQISKKNLRFNDLLIITTRNSVYTIIILDKNEVLVFGGWFSKKGLTPCRTQINGCTWGGCILKQDIVACCGMCIEFANRVTTSRIIKVQHYPSGD